MQSTADEIGYRLETGHKLNISPHNRITPGNLAQVLRCGSPYPNFGTSIPSNFLHSFTVTP